GTFTGVYRSRDAGATWELFSAGLSGSQIVDLVLDPHDGRFAYAATQFNGVYVIDQSDIAAPSSTTNSGDHDSSGCTLDVGTTGSSAWWLFSGALLIVIRRRQRRALRQT
ncbi:MAG TPA: hypothetical protein VMT89_03255, partial [Candidatus Acidoferrales bacterium]|nr:hypothetical protein [Candidatus Acidoferrales bacterium]